MKKKTILKWLASLLPSSRRLQANYARFGPVELKNERPGPGDHSHLTIADVVSERYGVVDTIVTKRATGRVYLFANEANAVDVVCIANEFKVRDDGWVQLSPFGDFDNVQGMQRVGPDESKNIVNEFNGLMNLPQRLVGLPWYVGHPDHPLFKDRYTDTRAYGRIKALETREDANCAQCKFNGKPPCAEHGLFANVKWNDEGKKLIGDEAFAGHSVNWRLRKAGGVFKPFSLKSVGFTNEPGIPVQPVTAANENTMNKLMDYIKKLLGSTEAEPMTEDMACEKLNAHVSGMCNERDKFKKDAETATTERDAANQKLSAAESAAALEKETGKKKEDAFAANETKIKDALASAGIIIPDGGDVFVLMSNEFTTARTAAGRVTAVETQMANERKTHAKLLLDAAVETGRITAAEIPAQEALFANEGGFEAARTALFTKPCNWKIASALDVGRKAGEVKDRQTTIVTMVNERMEKIATAKGGEPGAYYDEAFLAIRTENAQLFAGMKQPEGPAKTAASK